MMGEDINAVWPLSQAEPLCGEGAASGAVRTAHPTGGAVCGRGPRSRTCSQMNHPLLWGLQGREERPSFLALGQQEKQKHDTVTEHAPARHGADHRAGRRHLWVQ